MPKLTKTLIDALKHRETDMWVWDSTLPGLGVRVNPHGRKTYVVRYRTKDGRQRKDTLGRCCDFPPERARDFAMDIFAKVARGLDPAKEDDNLRNGPTVVQLMERYLSEHAIPYKKISSVVEDEAIIKNYVLPNFGNMKIREVTRAHILAFHASMFKKQPTANRVLSLLSKAFNLAELWEWREQNSNPVKGIKKYREQHKDRIINHNEIKLIMEQLNEPDIIPSFRLLIKLLFLTGCRVSEIAKARSEWVDLDRRLLLLPDSKVGQRAIQIPEQAVELLEDVHQREWVCPGRWTDKPIYHVWGMWRRVCRRAGIKGVRIHDIRHTVGSMAHGAGLSQKEIATLLGHRQLSTTERYIHGYRGEERIVEKVARMFLNTKI